MKWKQSKYAEFQEQEEWLKTRSRQETAEAIWKIPGFLVGFFWGALFLWK